MWARSLLATLLVSLAALSAVESAVDAAAAHASIRHQWQQQHGRHQGATRPIRRVMAPVEQLPAVPFARLSSPVALASGPDRLFILPAAIFVPPRV